MTDFSQIIQFLVIRVFYYILLEVLHRTQYMQSYVLCSVSASFEKFCSTFPVFFGSLVANFQSHCIVAFKLCKE